MLAPPKQPYAFSIELSTNYVGIGTGQQVYPLQVGDSRLNNGNGAHVTVGGVWTNASSRSFKEDIQPITSEQARETVQKLQPVGFRYINEPDDQYVGFIAEDVPDLVATRDRQSLSPMDITAVLTKVVQDQDRTIEEQRQTIAQQQDLLAKMNARLTRVEERLKSEPATK